MSSFFDIFFVLVGIIILWLVFIYFWQVGFVSYLRLRIMSLVDREAHDRDIIDLSRRIFLCPRISRRLRHRVGRSYLILRLHHHRSHFFVTKYIPHLYNTQETRENSFNYMNHSNFYHFEVGLCIGFGVLFWSSLIIIIKKSLKRLGLKG